MSKGLNIALIGYGKMGKAIESIAIERGHHISLRIGSSNPDQFTTENLQQCDVAIEFTNPESAVENIRKCLEAGTAVICGSTGWLENLTAIKALCKEKHGAFLYASNFSVGVNIFFEVNKCLAKLMARQNEYDVSIEEIHHTQKKEAPSGTAITLAEQVLQEVSRKTKWANEQTDAPSNLTITSKRIDPAPGTHVIKYSSPVDEIEIKHTAHSRGGFALGAVLAAEFIHNKNGTFNMKDVLGL